MRVRDLKPRLGLPDDSDDLSSNITYRTSGEPILLGPHMPEETSFGLDEALDKLGFREIRDSNRQSLWGDTRKLTLEIDELTSKLKRETERAEAAEMRAEKAERAIDILVRTIDAGNVEKNILATLLDELLSQRHINI